MSNLRRSHKRNKRKCKQFTPYQFDPLTASVPCRAWYDMSDSSTYTEQFGEIETLADKSPTANNLVEGDGPELTTFLGKTCAGFTRPGGGEQMIFDTPISLDGISNLSIYLVFSPILDAGSTNVLSVYDDFN